MSPSWDCRVTGECKEKGVGRQGGVEDAHSNTFTPVYPEAVLFIVYMSVCVHYTQVHLCVQGCHSYCLSI